MPAPVLVQSWFTRAERDLPDSATLQGAQRSWLWLLQAALLDLLTGGTTSGTRDPDSIWTCVGSSDGVTAGLDGTNRWGGGTYTPAALVRAAEGVAHSWMVLRNVNLGVWLLLNYNGGSEGNVNITISRVAYTGGSTTAKPTATNETSIGTATVASAVQVMAAESTFGVTYRFGIAICESGAFHVWTNRLGTGITMAWLGLFQLFNQNAGDQWPIWASIHSVASGRGAPQLNSISTPSVAAVRNPNLVARTTTGGIVTWQFAGTTFEAAGLIDALTGQWDALPMYCRTNDATQGAWRGNLQDAYVIGAPAIGSSWPTVGAQQMVVLGNLLLPCGVNLAL